MTPQLMVGVTAVLAMIVAILVLVWSPWDEDSAATSSEQIARARRRRRPGRRSRRRR
jgi:hypothetical protein